MKKAESRAKEGGVKAQRLPPSPEATGRHEDSLLLRLQQGAGNRAVNELLGGQVQRKQEAWWGSEDEDWAPTPGPAGGLLTEEGNDQPGQERRSEFLREDL